jgi:hypothetical protein
VYNEHVDPNVQDSPRLVYFELTFFSSKASDLPSQAAALAAITATGFTVPQQGPPLVSGFANMNVTLSPPSGASSCLGVRVRVTTNSYIVRLAVYSKTSAVTVNGNALDIDATKPGLIQGFTRVNVVTDAAPVLLNNVWADYLSFFPTFGLSRLHPDPSALVSTNTGDVYVSTYFGAGLSVATNGGNIRMSTVFCFCVFDSLSDAALKSCGDVKIAAGGKGRAVVSQAFAAYSASVSSVRGEVVLVNSGMLIAEDLVVTSVTGDVLLNNLIQVRGGPRRSRARPRTADE